MKKTTLLLLSAACASLMFACSSNTSRESADSSAVSTDTPAAATASDSASTAGMTDSTFTTKAAISGMAEVALGKMAAAKAANGDVKSFGQMMVTDHSKANEELMTIAKAKNLSLPAGLDAEHQAKSDSLSKLSGKDFDIAYAKAMVEGHEKTLALMKDEAANGKDAELKAFAAKTAPVVEHHLMEIKKIQGALK